MSFFSVMRIVESGVYDQKRRQIEIRERFAQDELCNTDDEDQAITLRNMYFVYLLLLGGLLLASGILLLERIAFRRFRRKSKLSKDLLATKNRDKLSKNLGLSQRYFGSQQLQMNWFLN